MASRLVRHRLIKFIYNCISLNNSEGITTVFGIAMLILLFFNPQHLPELCIIKRVFGYCPACGTTRALSCFLKGEYAESLKYNFNVIFTAPLFIYIFLKNLMKVIRNLTQKI